MGFIGKQPAKAAITSSDITDGIVTADKLASDSVTTAKIADNGVTTAKINADAVTDAKIADDVVGTEHLTAGEVDTTALGADAVTAAKIADDAISDEHLDPTAITGQTAETSAADDDLILLSDTSASAALKKMTRSNFLSGVGGNNTPIFLAQKTDSNQTISNTTDTVVTFNTELFDTANNFASNVFTPTTAGKYYLYAQVIWGSWSDQSLGVIYIRNTNSNTLISEKIVRGSGSSSFNLNTEIIAVANGSSDAFRVEVYQDTGGDKDVNASSRSTYFMGYKLIE